MRYYNEIIKRRKHFYDVLFLVLILFCIVLRIVLCAKQNNSDCSAQEIVTSGSIEFTTCISLGDIKAPEFGEVFCQLLLTGDSVLRDAVYWGVSDSVNSFTMWYESGYPGFGMPLVISGTGFVCKSDTVKLVTSYGVCEYKFISSGLAFNNNHHLIDYATKEEVTEYTADEESLLLYNEQTSVFWKYTLCKAPKIT